MKKADSPLKIRGRIVRTDAKGFVSLKDLHTASGFKTNRTPTQWLRLANTNGAVIALMNKTGTPCLSKKNGDIKSVLYAKEGRGGDMFAHPNLALSYAEFLNPSLGVEVREVFLRYKAGDATLADETLQRSTPEGNEWAARRAMARSVRNEYTEELKQRGVDTGFKFANCTNATYRALFDKTASQLKVERGIPVKSGNLRDKMSLKELAFVAASEALSIEHMVDVHAEGYKACLVATSSSAGAIRSALDIDRSRRQPRLP